jgi:hypothetical protein
MTFYHLYRQKEKWTELTREDIGKLFSLTGSKATQTFRADKDVFLSNLFRPWYGNHQSGCKLHFRYPSALIYLPQ